MSEANHFRCFSIILLTNDSKALRYTGKTKKPAIIIQMPLQNLLEIIIYFLHFLLVVSKVHFTFANAQL